VLILLLCLEAWDEHICNSVFCLWELVAPLLGYKCRMVFEDLHLIGVSQELDDLICL
jgi:hypothetical protein